MALLAIISSVKSSTLGYFFDRRDHQVSLDEVERILI
jgi:hypothetical protein